MAHRFHRFRIVSALFLVFFTLPPGIRTQESPREAAYTEAIEQFKIFVEDRMAADRVPGLSVGFIKGDFIWAEGFGYADIENGTPAKPTSSYRLASITKTMTAVAVLQLEEAGLIDLDAEVQAYVPSFPRKQWPVTIRQLLGHLGGISHYRNYEVEGRIKAPKTTAESLAVFQDFDLVAEPGTRYNYSSYGYNLLGAVVESAAGCPYGEYLRDHIFLPLNMSDSLMDDPVRLIPNRVRGYRLVEGELKNSEFVDVSSRFAAGGTRSTVVDLLKFARGIMDGKLLTKDTYRRMFTSMATKSGYGTGYGMGWNVRPWRGHFQISHGGSQPETRVFLAILPEDGFAVALASNLEEADLAQYLRRLAELVLDEDMDSKAYLPSKEEQALYGALEDVYALGLSQFVWNDGPLIVEGEDIGNAFDYLNSAFDLKALEADFPKAFKKIHDGLNPVTGSPLIKAGTHMASELIRAYGQESLSRYQKAGPLIYFSDYLSLTGGEPRSHRPGFSRSLAGLISQWSVDWRRVYSDPVRSLFITSRSDLRKTTQLLTETFTGARLYPDLSSDLARTAQDLLNRDRSEEALSWLQLATRLYPEATSSWSTLGNAQIWSGLGPEALSSFKKAFDLDPTHPSLGFFAFTELARGLLAARKTREFQILTDIFIELRPENPGTLATIGDWYLEAGESEQALAFFNKALKLNPRLHTVEEKIQKVKSLLKSPGKDKT